MKSPLTDLLLRVPNTEEGKQFYSLLKKYLNKKTYSLKKRGRHPNRKVIMANAGVRPNTCRDIPVNLASDFAIYLTRKDRKFWRGYNTNLNPL
jgi:hypothetical protein